MKNPSPLRVHSLLILCGVLFTASAPSQVPGGPPTGRGGRGGFAPGTLLGGQMIEQGDTNGDQHLTQTEMADLAEAWFDRLDPDRSGSLNRDQFSGGFSVLLAPPQGGGRGGPGGRGGRGGGPGGFMGGILFAAADSDKDGRVSRAEFEGVLERWATEFDQDRDGSVDRTELSAGLNAALPLPRRGGFGGGTPEPDDNTGFTSIFDGKSLSGWDGDPRYWRAEAGEIIGESTTEVPVEQNTFLIWRGGTTRDFELKVEFKISDGSNSGVQYRSEVLSDVGKWALKGYQADMDSANNFTGMVYEERGRGFLAPRGQFARRTAGGSKLIGTVGDSDALKAFIKPGDWNQLHIIARDGFITQSINGHLMSALLDEDDNVRAREGVLGLQIHTGPPMKLQFRNVFYKQL